MRDVVSENRPSKARVFGLVQVDFPPASAFSKIQPQQQLTQDQWMTRHIQYLPPGIEDLEDDSYSKIVGEKCDKFAVRVVSSTAYLNRLSPTQIGYLAEWTSWPWEQAAQSNNAMTCTMSINLSLCIYLPRESLLCGSGPWTVVSNLAKAMMEEY